MLLFGMIDKIELQENECLPILESGKIGENSNVMT